VKLAFVMIQLLSAMRRMEEAAAQGAIGNGKIHHSAIA